MSVQSSVGSRRFASRGLVAWLSLVAASSIAGGSLLWAESNEFFSETPPVVMFRTRPSMSRQPRPLSAPRRHFAEPVNVAVELVGIESFDETDGPPAARLPMGEWTPQR